MLSKVPTIDLTIYYKEPALKVAEYSGRGYDEHTIAPSAYVIDRKKVMDMKSGRPVAGAGAAASDDVLTPTTDGRVIEIESNLPAFYTTHHYFVGYPGRIRNRILLILDAYDNKKDLSEEDYAILKGLKTSPVDLTMYKQIVANSRHEGNASKWSAKIKDL
uniref:Uncharacterized protein n=1 Tax=viral metagenome TaxID=1070528 RepID=A0A6C0K1Z8_9ZZZZ